MLLVNFGIILQKKQKHLQRKSKQPAKQKPAKESKQIPLENRLSGDEYLNAIDKIEEIKSVGGKVDINGYITLYHATSNTNASEVLKTGKMTAQEDGLFFSTKKDGQISGYGDTVLEFSIPIERLIMDDLFDNEIHFRLPLASKKLQRMYRIT